MSVMTDSPPKMDSSNVPNLLKVGEIDVNMAMDVSTDVNEPIVVNQNTCRFNLVNKGFLSSDSRITIGVKANASVPDGFFPVNIGVHSLIKRATLSIGGQTICEIDDYNFFKTYESMFLSNEINRDRESVMSGRQMSHDFKYADTVGSQSDTSADSYALDLGTDFRENTLDMKPYLKNANTGVFSIRLSELFPFLKGINLPLFQISQEVLIDLVWEDSAARCCTGSDAALVGKTFDIDTTEVKLISDYIFYDGEIMQRYAAAHKTQSFAYPDYRLTKTSLSVDDAKNSVRNLGGAGRVVGKVITGISDDNRDSSFILNKYSAIAPSRDYTNGTPALRGNGTLTTNIRMNDHFVFPIDLDNSAVLFDKTARAEGSLPFVTREEYSGEGNILSTATLQGVPMNASTGLVSNFFWQSYKLPSGRINSRGLELTTKLVSLPALSGTDTYTQRTWIELRKVATLSDGFVNAEFV
mgnify:CR=1 FL=1